MIHPLSYMFSGNMIQDHRRRKGGGGGGRPPPIIWEGGPTYPLPPTNNPLICTCKTIPLNSILECSIISYFKMRNVIIWHWLIKNLMGTRRRNDVDATSLRRIDVVTTSCACWEFGPPLAPQNSTPWPPQYSKPSYAYEDTISNWRFLNLYHYPLKRGWWRYLWWRYLWWRYWTCRKKRRMFPLNYVSNDISFEKKVSN